MMIARFHNEAAQFAPEAIYTGIKPPFASFRIPGIVTDFANAVRADGFINSNALLFGGVFLDQKLGIATKDYDCYLYAPELVAQMKEADAVNPEAFEEITNYQFPLILSDDGVYSTASSHLFGTWFAVNGTYSQDGKRHVFDIIIGDKEPSSTTLSAQIAVPILSCVAAIGEDQTLYSYHRDFDRHADARILVTDEISNSRLIQKAKRKNLELVLPECVPAIA